MREVRNPLLARLINAAMRRFFKLLYHQGAWGYDFVAAVVSIGRWKKWVYSVLPYLSGPRILELGHGPGHLQLALIAKGLEAFGLDESREMGRLAFNRIRKEQGFSRLVSGYAQFIPFADCSVHQVVATFPSEFITAPDTLSEIHRVLVPGGELIILPAAWIVGNSLPDRMAAWLFKVTGQAPSTPPSTGQDASHEEGFTIPPPFYEYFLVPVQNAGFDARLEFLEQESSLLMLIRGKKRNQNLTH